MAEVSPEDVCNFLNFCEIVTGKRPDPQLAPRYIRDANGDLDRAIGNYEQNPERYTTERYDGTLFSQIRNGGSCQYAGMSSFQVEHADGSLAQGPKSTAATRPNTPSNSMHDSAMGDSQVLAARGGQENGVIGASGVHFGPATREYYDQREWTMTALSSTSSEPSPTQRRRESGEPAFMKPVPSQGYLPSLLTILNTIPEAHNTLLLKGHLLSHYGENAQWWSGSPITAAETIDYEDPACNKAQTNVIRETQRIMAFLDHTERSYGSTEPLSKMIDSGNDYGEKDATVGRFLDSWSRAVSQLEPGATHEGLFRTTAQETRGDEVSITNSNCFTPFLTNTSTGLPASLYDVLDETVWINDPDGISSMYTSSIKTVSRILIMVVKQDDAAANGLNMTIPVSWYADRYLLENEVRARYMRRSRADVKWAMGEIKARAQQLSTFRFNGTPTGSLDLLEIAMSAMTIEPLDPTGEPLPNPNAERDARLHRRIQSLYDGIKHKLEELKCQEEKAQQTYNDLSSLLKESTDGLEAEANPQIKYRLCGMSTDPGVTYIQSRRKPSLNKDINEVVQLDMADASLESADWWRIHYDSTGQISMSCMSEAETLATAAMENREALLVYAREDALDLPFEDVPQALADFVSRDNMLFREELDQDAVISPSSQVSVSLSDNEPSKLAQSPKKGWSGNGQRGNSDMTENLAANMASKKHQDTPAPAHMDADAGPDIAKVSNSQHLEFSLKE